MTRTLWGASALALIVGAGPALADMDAAEKWIDGEFQPSAISRDEQRAETASSGGPRRNTAPCQSCDARRTWTQYSSTKV